MGNALSEEIELPRVLRLVADRLRDLIGARDVFIALPVGSRLVVRAASGEAVEALVGGEIPSTAKSMRVLQRGRSERVDSLIDDPEVDHEFTRRLGVTTGLYVPLVVRGHPIGVVVAHDKQERDPRFTHQDLRLAETFA